MRIQGLNCGKYLVFLLVITLLTSIFVTCSTYGRDQVLVLAANDGDLKSADPHIGSTAADHYIHDMVFNGLLRYAPGNIEKIEPDLALTMPEQEILPDGRQVWTFRIREGVMTHPWGDNPGYEITSEDIVYSLQRKAADPARSAFAGEYGDMAFEAVDKYTVKITLDKAISPVLLLPKFTDIYGGCIVPKRPIEEMGDEAFRTHPVGTGPFMYHDYIPMEKFVLVRHEAYFRGKPYLEKVVVRFMPEVNSREMGLETGELDVIRGEVDEKWLNRLAENPDLFLSVVAPGENAILYFNMSKPPWDILKVRQAVAYALRREPYILYYGGKSATQPLYSVVPTVLSGGLTRDEVKEAGLLYEQDLDRARQLLAEAGFPDGFSVNNFVTVKRSYAGLYEIMQAQLKKIGIDLTIRPVEHSTYHYMIREDLDPLPVYICWRPNADLALTRFFHSKSIVVTGELPDTNFSHYNRIDDLLDKARSETDSDVQIALWKEAQLEILRDMAAYPLFTKTNVFVCQSYVDWGHEVKASLSNYPQITEQTRLLD